MILWIWLGLISFVVMKWKHCVNIVFPHFRKVWSSSSICNVSGLKSFNPPHSAIHHCASRVFSSSPLQIASHANLYLFPKENPDTALSTMSLRTMRDTNLPRRNPLWIHHPLCIAPQRSCLITCVSCHRTLKLVRGLAPHVLKMDNTLTSATRLSHWAPE